MGESKDKQEPMRHTGIAHSYPSLHLNLTTFMTYRETGKPDLKVICISGP
jgi:hypothetical protein